MSQETDKSNYTKLETTSFAQRRVDLWLSQRRVDLKPLGRKAHVVKLDRESIRERRIKEGSKALDNQQNGETNTASPIVTGNGRMIPVGQIPRL